MINDLIRVILHRPIPINEAICHPTRCVPAARINNRYISRHNN